MSQTKVKSGLLNFPDQTDFVKLPSGTTAQRPSSPEKGYSRYNTTDNKLEFWNGTIWQQLPGVVAPTIESVSYPGDDLAADPDGGQTITLTGTNFLDGASIEIDGTTSSVVTVVSKTEITFTAPAKTAGDYDILLTNGDNTTATFIDGITYNGLPSWTTPAGNLGTFPAGSTIPTITLVATEPDSGVVSYSVTTGALPTGLALTGADIDGTVPSPAGQTTYNFSVTASDDENQESTERAFNIVVYLQVTNTVSEVDPFGDSSGVALYRLENNANDEGGVYNGTPSNVTYGTGVFGQAGVFNGSNSKVISSASISGNSERTLSVWYKTTAADNILVSLGPASGTSINNQHFAISPPNANSLNIYGFNGPGPVADELMTGFSTNLISGNWTHIVVTWDGQVGGTLKAYVNGALESSLTRASGAAYSTAAGFQIGNWISGNRYLNGSIDQVRILNRAITPLEVESLYRERTVVCGGQADTLDILGDNSCIATYQLDGNANDLSGNYSGRSYNNLSYGVGEFDLSGNFQGEQYIKNSSGYGIPINNNQVKAVSVWFKLEGNLSGKNTVWSSGKPANGDAYGILQIINGYLSADHWGGYTIPANTYAITPNTWYNIVYSGSDAYLNGTYWFSYGKALGVDSDTYGFYIGANGSYDYGYITGAIYGAPFNGQIDQVRIFNKALNQAEVTTLYNETACDALACGGTTNTLDILSDGSCVAAYPLDGSPADLSGNYNGVQTDVTYPVGKYDLVASFNGSSSSIDSGYSLPASSDSSFSFWFKTSNTSTKFLSTQGVVTGSANQLSIAIVSSGTRLEIQVGNSYIDFAGTITNGAWHNFVFSRNASSGYTLYLDGSFLGTFSNTTALQSANLFLGTRSDNTSLTFDGQIDQVRIFNKALSAGEVTTLYNETACN